MATLAVVVALGGLAACGKSDKEVSAAQPLPAGVKACDGLPAYEITGRSKDGDPLLRFRPDADCATYLYDEDTGFDIPNSLVNKTSTFFACYAGGKPEHIEATLTYADHLGPTGAINLGYAASAQRAASRDIPPC